MRVSVIGTDHIQFTTFFYQAREYQVDMQIGNPLAQKNDNLALIGSISEHSYVIQSTQNFTITRNQRAWPITNRMRCIFQLEECGRGLKGKFCDVFECVDTT